LRVLLLVLAGCYSPALRDGQYLCPDGSCPPSQICSPCGICVSRGDAPHGGLACPGCALGERSAGDLRLPNLALCGAAWTVPGVSSDAPASLATPCNREPDNDGISVVDRTTACSVEDSCAPGWHVCADEDEASARGLTRQKCQGLDSEDGNFWATRMPGTRVIKDATAASCAAAGQTGATVRLIGCGPLYSTKNTQVCSVLARYIGEIPASGTAVAWDCAAHSGGAWQCGSDGTEALDVVKPSAAHGGVLCCRDRI
jgi:hypothetical protein